MASIKELRSGAIHGGNTVCCRSLETQSKRHALPSKAPHAARILSIMRVGSGPHFGNPRLQPFQGCSAGYHDALLQASVGYNDCDLDDHVAVDVQPCT